MLNATAVTATYWTRMESHAQVGCSTITRANRPVDKHFVLHTRHARVPTYSTVLSNYWQLP